MPWLLTLLGLVVLVAAVLAVPLHFRFAASMDAPGDRLRRSARFMWAFGLVNVALTDRPKKPRAATLPRRPAPKKQKRTARHHIGRLLLNPALWSQVKRLLMRLHRTIHWRTFRLDARFGLDDPANTGRVWGVIGPVIALFPFHPHVDIRPVFDGPALAFHGEGEIRVVPLDVIGVLLWFAVSPGLWRILWPALRNR